MKLAPVLANPWPTCCRPHFGLTKMGGESSSLPIPSISRISSSTKISRSCRRSYPLKFERLCVRDVAITCAAACSSKCAIGDRVVRMRWLYLPVSYFGYHRVRQVMLQRCCCARQVRDWHGQNSAERMRHVPWINVQLEIAP